jgi:hypothetical protein
VRHLTELKLWEISAVTFPMNESAVVTGVKGLSDDERARHLKAINEHRKAIDRHQQGIRTHLKECSTVLTIPIRRMTPPSSKATRR